MNITSLRGAVFSISPRRVAERTDNEIIDVQPGWVSETDGPTVEILHSLVDFLQSFNPPLGKLGEQNGSVPSSDSVDPT